jgi:putative lipoic acid-binding regulatory protein
MGVFDPQGEDDERQQGNIMNAILTFPVQYSFNVVGRTGGDAATVDQFVEQVKQVVIQETGDEDGIQCTITPRSKNFTKLTIRANVANANMITAAYNGIEALELTVMRF